MKKTSFHYSDCLCGILGVEIVRQILPTLNETLPIWQIACVGVIIVCLRVIEK